jgi:hypothetical protein
MYQDTVYRDIFICCMMINKNPIDEQLAKRQWRAAINKVIICFPVN